MPPRSGGNLTPEARLFIGMHVGAVTDRTYLRVFHEARASAFTPEEAASPLMEVPCSLRHAAFQFGCAPPVIQPRLLNGPAIARRRPLVQTGCSRTLEVELQLSSSLVRSQFSLCGRCWIRTNVGEADGFTDRHSKSIPLGQIVLPVNPWDGMGIGDPHATIASRCHSDIRDKKPGRCAKRVTSDLGVSSREDSGFAPNPGGLRPREFFWSGRFVKERSLQPKPCRKSQSSRPRRMPLLRRRSVSRE
jgi:hypothetical protein